MSQSRAHSHKDSLLSTWSTHALVKHMNDEHRKNYVISPQIVIAASLTTLHDEHKHIHEQEESQDDG